VTAFNHLPVAFACSFLYTFPYFLFANNKFSMLHEICHASEVFHNCSYGIIFIQLRENIKTSAKENLGYQKLKHNTPWFDVECSKLIDKRKQAIL
jgi:hypothetical protein